MTTGDTSESASVVTAKTQPGRASVNGSARHKYRVELRETVTVEMEGDDHCDDDIMERAIEKAGDFPNATIVILRPNQP